MEAVDFFGNRITDKKVITMSKVFVEAGTDRLAAASSTSTTCF
jgi:hypothetical protein